MLKYIFLVFFSIFAFEVCSQVIYVDSAATGSDNGTNWENAFTDLQDALQGAENGQEVWVAKGTYFPTTSSDRTIYFELPEDVDLYGGFSGDEDDISQRNIASNPTILSGDIGTPGDQTDNTYHVVFADHLINESPVQFDGFIVEQGYAHNSNVIDNGGAMLINQFDMVIKNCIFRNNSANESGGALHVNFSYIPILNCEFYSNEAGFVGGAVYGNIVHASIRDCLFENNLATVYAGALRVDGYSVYNSTFRMNHAAESGGAAAVNSESKMIDCTFESNSADRNAGAVTSLGGSYFFGCSFSNNFTTGTNGIGHGGAISAGGTFSLSFTEILCCEFINNSTSGDGGALFLDYTEPTIANCLFNNNHADSDGGAIMYSSGSNHMKIGNSTFVNNTCGNEGSVLYDYNLWLDPTLLDNCILWNNGPSQIVQQPDSQLPTEVRYSILQSPNAGTGNLLTEPDFTNPSGDDGIPGNTDDDFHLETSSPGVNQGNSNLSGFYYLPEDFAGNPRIAGGIIDMGYLEDPICSETLSAAATADSAFLCHEELYVDVSAEEPEVGVGKWTLISGSTTIDDPYSNNTEIGPVTEESVILVWSVQNCDITNTDTLVIVQSPEIPLPEITVSNSPSFCDGDSVVLSAPSGFEGYSWNTEADAQSITVSESGSYSVTVTNEYGCSNASNNIDVNVLSNPSQPSITYTEDNILCGTESVGLLAPDGFAEYEWSNGESSQVITVDESVTLSVRVKDSQGCWSEFSEGAQVFQFENPSPPLLAIEGMLEFCDGDSVIVSVEGSYEQYTWSNGSNNQSVTISSSTELWASVTDENGCSSENSDTLNLENLTLDPPQITSAEPEVCEGDSVILDGPDGFDEYYWSNDSTGFSIALFNSGQVQLQVENYLGCLSPPSEPFEVIVNPLPAPPQIDIDGSTEFCEGEDVTLIGPPGFDEYNWSNGFEGPNNIISSEGNYWLQVTDVNNCTSSNSDTIGVQINPLPPQPAIEVIGSTSFCPGDSVLLTAPEGFDEYQWSDGSSEVINTIYTSNDISVRVTDENNCISPWSEEIEVEVLVPAAPPDIIPQPLAEICEGESVQLVASNGYQTYFWTTGDEAQSITITNPGDFQVAAIDENGCLTGNSEPTTVVVNPVPLAPLITVENLNSLNTEVDADNYFWFFNGEPISQNSDSFNANQVGSYSLQVEENGCLSDTSNVVFIECTDIPMEQSAGVYPNPNTGNFTLQLEGYVSTSADITFYNPLGQKITRTFKVDTDKCAQNEYEFEFSGLASGTYIILLEVDNDKVKVPMVVLD